MDAPIKRCFWLFNTSVFCKASKRRSRCLKPQNFNLDFRFLIFFRLHTGTILGYTISIQPDVEARLNISSTLGGILLACLPGGLSIGLLTVVFVIPHHKPLWLAGSVQLCGIFSFFLAVTLSHIPSPNGGSLPLKNVSSNAVFCDEGFLNATRQSVSGTSSVVLNAGPDTGTVSLVGLFLWLIGFTAGLPFVVMINQLTLHAGIFYWTWFITTKPWTLAHGLESLLFLSRYVESLFGPPRISSP